MAKLNVKGFGMVLHLNADPGNTAIYKGYINQEGHELHEKEIVKTVFTPKNVTGGQGLSRFGKPEVTWHVADGSKEPPLFETLVLLMDNYKLKSQE